MSPHALVLSLVASGVSRLISAPLYTALAELQLQRLPATPPDKKKEPRRAPSS